MGLLVGKGVWTDGLTISIFSLNWLIKLSILSDSLITLIESFIFKVPNFLVNFSINSSFNGVLILNLLDNIGGLIKTGFKLLLFIFFFPFSRGNQVSSVDVNEYNYFVS